MRYTTKKEFDTSVEKLTDKIKEVELKLINIDELNEKFKKLELRLDATKPSLNTKSYTKVTKS